MKRIIVIASLVAITFGCNNENEGDTNPSDTTNINLNPATNDPNSNMADTMQMKDTLRVKDTPSVDKPR